MRRIIYKLLTKILDKMSNYIDKTNLGTFESIEALWAAHPDGGHEGDYCYISGIKYRWNKYDRMWENAGTYTATPGRETKTFDGDVNIQNRSWDTQGEAHKAAVPGTILHRGGP